MSKIIVFTRAYNAERTLRRTIKSVLAQTEKDFRYYILDSASSDKTLKIIKEYAKKDKRIVPLHNDINRVTAYVEYLDDLIEENGEDSFFALIDSDDVFEPTFLEDLLAFMKNNDLDIAACGKSFIVEDEERVFETRVLKENLLFDKSDYDPQFNIYLDYYRQVSGKLFRSSVLKMCSFDKMHGQVFGEDTIFGFEALKYARKAGILAKKLTSIYFSGESAARKLDLTRVESPKMVYGVLYDFLSSFGPVSNRSQYILFMDYLSLIRELLIMISKSEIDSKTKFEYIANTFSRELTKELLQSLFIPDEEKMNFICLAISITLGTVNASDKEDIVTIGKILKDMSEGYSPILIYRNCMMNLTDGEFKNALSALMIEMTIINIAPAIKNVFILLGEILSIHLSDTYSYVFFKTLMIALLIEFKKEDLALKDLRSLAPMIQVNFE
jgi:glycosyltransferase involved in cell wall biosynthesis